MKKPVKPTKPGAPKKSVKSGQANKSRTTTRLLEKDEDFFSLLGEAFVNDIRLDPDYLDEDSPSELFVDFLESCNSDDIDQEDRDELCAELVETLSGLRVATNSGDRKAREEVQHIYNLLEDELEDKSLSLPDIILFGKILSDAGWEVPERLRQSVAEAFEIFSPSLNEAATGDIMSPLQEVMAEAQEDPFEAYEFMVSMLASFPVEHGDSLLNELIFQNDAALNYALIGFFLHPEETYSRSVANGIAQTATKGPNESLMIERLLRIRPWVPEERQLQLDAVIKVMRQNARPPVQLKAAKIIKGYASVCDGVGTMTIMATLRADKAYHICSLMIKSTGVSEVLMLEDMPKTQMDMIVRQLKTSVQTHEIDIEGIRKLLALSLADNNVFNVLPPFRLVQACEVLGIGTIPPDDSTPIEIFTSLLSEVPPDQIDETAANRAHQDVLYSALTENWFEAGEEIEDLLYPVRGQARRLETVLKVYLPTRREFWARQCAFSALAMGGDCKSRLSNQLWKQLALVGRDIASDKPLEQIPLMRKIAAITVEAFESQE
jgi:hypothetical protein